MRREVIRRESQSFLEFTPRRRIVAHSQKQTTHSKMGRRVARVRLDPARKQIALDLLFAQALIIVLRALRLPLVAEPPIDLVEAEVEHLILGREVGRTMQSDG